MRTCRSAPPPAAAILAIADVDEPPPRVFFGDRPLPLMRTEYARRIAEWEAWDDLSGKAFGRGARHRQPPRAGRSGTPIGAAGRRWAGLNVRVAGTRTA
ncbi:hypothetical protein [Streptomyces sp. NBC_00448]|uniref:hypothetical protein n=1 Tax=Streptomyces sp. NBC_00448 TaxID=2903652 RepID=UPI002E1EB654